jgi:hypothetical protein
VPRPIVAAPTISMVDKGLAIAAAIVGLIALVRIAMLAS